MVNPALAYLIQGTALGLSAAAAPGPFQTYLISQTLLGGWRRGAPIAFAPLISDPPVVIIILLLLKQVPPGFITIITLTGGLFALYLAYELWRQWWEKDQSSSSEIDGETTTSNTKNLIPDEAIGHGSEENSSAWRITAKGAMMNILSPGVYVFWMFVNGPILLSAYQQSAGYGIAFLIGFYGIFIAGLLGIVTLFHFAHRLGPRVVRTLTLISVIILAIFGIFLTVHGVTGLVKI